MTRFTTLLLFLLLPLLAFPQASALEGLQQARTEIEQKIRNLEDSLISIDQRITTLKSEYEHTTRANQDFSLVSSPADFGQPVLKIKKGTPLQLVDSIGEYYLVCFSGTCGYAHKKFITEGRVETILSDAGKVSKQ